MAQSLFSMLDAEWRDVVEQPDSALHLRHWSRHDPALRPFRDLEELVQFARQPGHPADSDDVLRCLAKRSASESLAARTLLQAIVYALKGIAARFRPPIGDGEEVVSVVIAAAYERIRTYPADRRPRHVAANIVLDTRQTVSRSLYRRRVTETLVGDIERLPVEAASSSPSEQLIALVDEALRRKYIGPREARLIVLTRLLDVPIDDLAAEHGCLPHSMRRRRLRAESVLAAAVA